MAAIWEYPDIDELENILTSAIEQGINEIAEENEDAELLVLEDIFIIEDWAEDDAEISSSRLVAMVFFDFEGEIMGDRLAMSPTFDALSRRVTIRAEDLIISNELDAVNVPDRFLEFFFTIDMRPQGIDQRGDQINILLGRSEENAVFHLDERERISFAEPLPPEEADIFTETPQPVLFDELPRTSLEELRKGIEKEEETVAEPAEEIVEEEEEPEFPDVEKPLRRFAVSDDELEIPAGKHEMKIEAREPYPFEVEMASFEEEVEDIADDVLDEIGESLASKKFGDADPPGTFPRTGIYIRNRLTFEGVTYIYQLYKDLVYYSGYITGLYSTVVDSGFTTGTYLAFREYIYVLRQIGEQKDAPTPIRMLSQQAAASRGLSVTPDHPTIEGADAPWLANRQYIQIVDEDAENVWRNAYKFYHGDDNSES